jgi:hypothetical protein
MNGQSTHFQNLAQQAIEAGCEVTPEGRIIIDEWAFVLEGEGGPELSEGGVTVPAHWTSWEKLVADVMAARDEEEARD